MNVSSAVISEARLFTLPPHPSMPLIGTPTTFGGAAAEAEAFIALPAPPDEAVVLFPPAPPDLVLPPTAPATAFAALPGIGLNPDPVVTPNKFATDVRDVPFSDAEIADACCGVGPPGATAPLPWPATR